MPGVDWKKAGNVVIFAVIILIAVAYFLITI